jgi:hypothetical protein
MSRRPLSGPLGNWSVVEAPQGSAPTKGSLCLSTGGPHKALRLCANDEIMLLIKRVRLK